MPPHTGQPLTLTLAIDEAISVRSLSAAEVALVASREPIIIYFDISLGLLALFEWMMRY
jgi:hypothetical protein